jgi:hypothetical protein
MYKYFLLILGFFECTTVVDFSLNSMDLGFDIDLIF